jgi:isochorismate hydrolase
MLLNKENKVKEKRYAIDFVENQHMLHHEEWPVHVPVGYIQRSVMDPETQRVVLKKFWRPNLRRLDEPK